MQDKRLFESFVSFAKSPSNKAHTPSRKSKNRAKAILTDFQENTRKQAKEAPRINARNRSQGHKFCALTTVFVHFSPLFLRYFATSTSPISIRVEVLVEISYVNSCSRVSDTCTQSVYSFCTRPFEVIMVTKMLLSVLVASINAATFPLIFASSRAVKAYRAL